LVSSRRQFQTGEQFEPYSLSESREIEVDGDLLSLTSSPFPIGAVGGGSQVYL
jgi:hypothetical protein